MEYENPWLFNGEPFTDDKLENFFGFVYLITNKITGKKYIGRKYFYSTNRIKQVGKKNRKVVRKQSDWKKYYGSSKTLLADIAEHGSNNFKREILSLHESRGDVNYQEIKQQIVEDVLNKEDYYNDNILSRYFRKKKAYRSEFCKENIDE